MANIHINRAGQNLGIFSEEDVRSGLRSGRFSGTDLAWREGMANWQPLSQFTDLASDLPAAGTTAATAPAATTPAAPTAAAPVTTTAATGAPVATTRTEPLAIWSLVLSCLGLVCCGFILGIPGIICGHMALSKLRAQPALEGRGMAMAGLIIGYVGVAFWLIYTIFFGGLGFLQSLRHNS